MAKPILYDLTGPLIHIFEIPSKHKGLREVANALTFLACCTLSSPAIHVVTVAGPQAL